MKLLHLDIETAPHRVCRVCALPLPETKFRVRRKSGYSWREHTCKDCRREQALRWQADNPQKVQKIRRRTKIKQKYGITEKEYKEMLEAQGGKCAICNEAPKRRKLDIDHCHVTGRVRGILCEHCNRALGGFRDDPERLQRAIKYLEAE